MNRKARKLTLRKETVRNLETRDLERAVGGTDLHKGYKQYDGLSLGNTRCSTSGLGGQYTCAHDTL